MGKLCYFDIHGRAAPIRMLLAHKGIEYEDERLSFEAFGALKAAGKVKALPVWEEDGKIFNESKALLRFLGTRHGYYPRDVNIAWQCDALVDYFPALVEKFNKHFLSEEFPEEVLDDFKETMDKLMEKCETQLTKHGKKFLVNENLTIADFMIFGNIASWFCNDSFVFKEQTADLMEELRDDHRMFFKWVDYMKEECAEHLEKREARKF